MSKNEKKEKGPSKPPTKKQKIASLSSQTHSDPPPPPSSSSHVTNDLSTLGSTSLQTKMRTKLLGARLRWINERLYLTTGSEAASMMESEPGLFEEYHSSFSQQTESWPSSPVSVIAERIRREVKSTENKVIVDLGAGIAMLAKELGREGYKVLSFDLVANEWVVKAQCTEKNGVPLPAEIVDVVVCCLSLMGTDWLGMIREAKRISKDKAKLVIAEVASRMDEVDEFVKVVEEVGWKKTEMDTSNSHFGVFWFEKDGKKKEGKDLEERSRKALKPCLYKKR
ncbi:hypothetical protein BT69DRAFT_1211861 [Atractiella rhizophila]|nr:hypothetical protein BT69DRAFT_1211861 [Atractiella rhizophila]